jgi:5-methylcytosine-specific restriction endonuclease McrA
MIKDSIVGKSFGKWKVLGYDKRREKWTVQCTCGHVGKHTRTDLVKGRSTQCMGCYSRRLQPDESAFNAVWNDYVQQAKRRQLEWSLTREQARKIFSSSCFYCGIVPSRVKTIPNGHGSFSFNGIDRKNNSSGYVLKNCVPCCRICNFMKSDMSLADFLKHVRRIYGRCPHHNQRQRG